MTATGLTVLIYGFFGIWMSDRRRKLWRLNLHRKTAPFGPCSKSGTEIAVLIQIVLTAMTAASVAVIPIFEPDKVRLRLIISTFIVHGFLL